MCSLADRDRIDIAMPTATKLPEYFRKNGYSNPWDSQKSPFAFAFGEEFWSWLKQNAEQSAVINGFMASRRQGMPSWFDIYPVERELVPSGAEFGNDEILLIDVGGNKGHDLLHLRAKYPHLPGRFILQDLPTVVDHLDMGDHRISAMAHNFFEPQPVKRNWPPLPPTAPLLICFCLFILLFLIHMTLIQHIFVLCC